MTKNRITGEQVWDALKEEANFLAEVPEGAPRAIFRELCLELPTILKEDLDAPLTLKTLMRAKVTMLDRMNETGLLRRLVEAYPLELLNGMPREMLVDTLADSVTGLVAAMQEILEDFDAWFARAGVHEADILADPKHGRLNAAAMEAYRAGTLTVGGLLVLQPWALIKNTD